MDTNTLSWIIIVTAMALILVRPGEWPEAIWAVAGALLLVLCGQIPRTDAWQAIEKGQDVYFFLIGMMLLAEVGRESGLFEWAANLAVAHARGSCLRLFALIYAVGVVVTTFMSNDATAVVLTPAVFAATRRARVDPLPCLFACALVANAASLVLLISNPANLVMYGSHTPPLLAWLRSFLLPSIVAIVLTALTLGWTQKASLAGDCEANIEVPPLGMEGRIVLGGVIVTAVALVAISVLDRPLGLATAVLGLITASSMWLWRRSSPVSTLRGISWTVLPLVAGLFVMVESLNRSGLVAWLSQALNHAVRSGVNEAAAASGAIVAFTCNLANNLPAGLLVSTTVSQVRPPQQVVDALLIGVDLGPNLSITGSLATILWLSAIRREGVKVSFGKFLMVGAIVMPVALAGALATRLMLN